MKPTIQEPTSDGQKQTTPLDLSPYYMGGIPMLAFFAVIGGLGLLATIFYQFFVQ